MWAPVLPHLSPADLLTPPMPHNPFFPPPPPAPAAELLLFPDTPRCVTTPGPGTCCCSVALWGKVQRSLPLKRILQPPSPQPRANLSVSPEPLSCVVMTPPSRSPPVAPQHPQDGPRAPGPWPSTCRPPRASPALLSPRTLPSRSPCSPKCVSFSRNIPGCAIPRAPSRGLHTGCPGPHRAVSTNPFPRLRSRCHNPRAGSVLSSHVRTVPYSHRYCFSFFFFFR